MLNPRFIPPIAWIGLLAIKMFDPTFLDARPLAWLPVSWFSITFLLLGLLAAWCITPAFLHILTNVSTRFIVPPAILIAIVVAAIWAADQIYNHTIALLFGVPQIHWLDRLSSSLFGTPGGT